MSGSTGQKIGGAIGATIGFFVGGPAGAIQGYQIGSSIGGAIDPPVVQGPQIGELAAQTSREGEPRPTVFGISRPIGGNIIATTEPIIRKKKQQSGGKGGGPEVESEEVYRTYAIRICEGPISGIRRVWRNGKLVYDTTSATQTAINNAAEFLKLATFYNGDWDQQPDPDLQAAFGVNNVVAHRGTAYMVIDNENLTQLGGAIPQYTFEVVRNEGFFLTSRPYPIEVIEAMDSGFVSIETPPSYSLLAEAFDSSFESVTGSLNSIFSSYDNYAPEAMDSSFESVVGTLGAPLVNYENYAPEALDSSVVSVAGSLDVVLLTYSNYDPEGMDSTFVEVTGTLT